MCRIAKCVKCGNVASVKLDLYKRGGRPAWLCDFCAYRRHDYHSDGATNFEVRGTDKVQNITGGIELETSYSTLKARVELCDNGFIPTADSTVDVEYVSPIYKGFNALSKHLVTIERLINNGDLEINSSCGTHLHIGTLTSESRSYIMRFYHSLFMPLQSAIDENENKSKQFWGRSFEYWCGRVSYCTDADEHRNFINMQHSKTLEFRMAKFKNAKQYMQVVHFCKWIYVTIQNNFISKFDNYQSSEKLQSKYPSERDYRKALAQRTGEKIAKKYRKIIAEM